MATLRIFLFGGLRVEADGNPVPPETWSRYRLARKLLSRLALAPQHRLHRDSLIETLWRDRLPADPDNRLSQEASNIQRALDQATTPGPRYVRRDQELLVLSPPEPVWTDVDAFLQLARQAREARDIAAYHTAVQHYGSQEHGNQLLPEYASEWWVASRQEELRDIYVSLLVDLARLHATVAQFVDTEQLLKQVLGEVPTHEEAHRGLMCLFAQSGRRDRALQQFAHLREVLALHHNADVSAESADLYQRILADRIGTEGVARELTTAVVALAPDVAEAMRSSCPQERNGTPPGLPLSQEHTNSVPAIPAGTGRLVANDLGRVHPGAWWRRALPVLLGVGLLLAGVTVAQVTAPGRGPFSAASFSPGGSEAVATGPEASTGPIGVLLRDDLSQATAEWDLRPRDLRDPLAQLAGYDGGELYLVKPSGNQLRSIAVQRDLFTDFLAEVDVRMVSPGVDSYVSLDFRRQVPPEDDDYYSLQVFPNDRTYRGLISQRSDSRVGMTAKPGVDWSALVARTGSSVINNGDGRNHLAVRAVGTDILLMVNGQELARITDSQYRGGRFVLGVGGAQGDRVEGRFSNFVVSATH